MMRTVEIFLKPWQVSDYLGIPIDEIYNMLEEKELPGMIIDGSWRIRKTDLEKWLDEDITEKDVKALSKRIEKVDKKKVHEYIDKAEKKTR
jgi:excisionase family DNA binding protein